MRHRTMRLPCSLPLLMWAAPVVLVALSGCAPNRVEPASEPVSGGTVIHPPRSARGNPPFYDVLGQRYCGWMPVQKPAGPDLTDKAILMFGANIATGLRAGFKHIVVHL